MARTSISIPAGLHDLMQLHPEVNWSQVCQVAIRTELAILEPKKFLKGVGKASLEEAVANADKVLIEIAKAAKAIRLAQAHLKLSEKNG